MNSSNSARFRVSQAARLSRIQACMERYVSPMIVEGMIDRTLSKRGLSRVTLSDSMIPKLVEDSMVGLRLFVDAKQLPSLMVELAEILEDA